MKTLRILFAAVVTVGFAAALAESTVTQAPLSWKQVAVGDGESLYLELCAVCHGTAGKGDGPAAPALSRPTPDLTGLAAGNGGVFPREAVEETIAGEDRVVAHGTLEMPIWGNEFAELRPDWKGFRRDGFARQRIYNLTSYLETLQVQ